MKHKLEASGCKCNPQFCTSDCKNDNYCEAKIQYAIDNISYDLNMDKIKYNAGLRFIAKICLNSLWGGFGMKEDYFQNEYTYTSEQLTNIIYNDKYKDISTKILDEDIVLVQYKTKEHYKKPNSRVNVYIAAFTTAYARLRLYNLLDILQERVMYIDTDSCIYHDDNSEACEKIKKMIGSGLGELTDEISGNYIKQFVSLGPKDYSYELDNGKQIGKCKGFRINNEAEDKITMDKKIKLATYKNEPYEMIPYKLIKNNKKN